MAASSRIDPGMPRPCSSTTITVATSGASEPAAIRHLGITGPPAMGTGEGWGRSGDRVVRTGFGRAYREHPVESGDREEVLHPLHRCVQLEPATGRGQPLVDPDQDGEPGRVAERHPR